MTKERKIVFGKLFSDFQTISTFTAKNRNAQETKAYDDVYSIIDNAYCIYDTEENISINALYYIKQKIKEKYHAALGLWCSTQYLETLEEWYDYILYGDFVGKDE